MASYGEIRAQLLLESSSRQTHTLFSLPISPHKPIIPSSSVANLSLHPVLESLLHILNLDLPSAHFLLRHMQAAPAWEAMYLHGILHRIEGDLDNARAWYSDAKNSEAFREVWCGVEWPGSTSVSAPGVQASRGNGLSRSKTSQSTEPTRENDKPAPTASSIALDRSLSFLNDLNGVKSLVRSGQSPPAHLVQTSINELSRLLKFCETKFGTDSVPDASKVWMSMAEKHADIAEKMITGGEGWRQF